MKLMLRSVRSSLELVTDLDYPKTQEPILCFGTTWQTARSCWERHSRRNAEPDECLARPQCSSIFGHLFDDQLETGDLTLTAWLQSLLDSTLDLPSNHSTPRTREELAS